MVPNNFRRRDTRPAKHCPLHGSEQLCALDLCGYERLPACPDVLARLFRPGGQATTVNDGKFHFLAVTYNGTTETVYLDGTAIGSLAFTQQAYSPVYYYQLGTGYTAGWPAGVNGWDSFTGLIDEAALYNRALSPTEVQANYNAGKSNSAAIVGLGDTASRSYTLTINALTATTTTTLSGGAASPAAYGTSATFTATVNTTASPNIAGGLEGFYYNLSASPTAVASAFNVSNGAPAAGDTLIASRTDAQVDVPYSSGFFPTTAVSGLNSNNVGVSWSGLIQINAAGTYTFYSPSDDGSLLYIDGGLAVNNDGQHGFVDGLSIPSPCPRACTRFSNFTSKAMVTRVLRSTIKGRIPTTSGK